MRLASMGVLGVCLVLAAGVGLADHSARSQATASQATVGQEGLAGVGGNLIVLPGTANDKQQQIIVVDAQQRVLSVYQVNSATGEIALKCVRNIHWDLQIEAFNSLDPQPSEVRTLLEKR